MNTNDEESLFPNSERVARVPFFITYKRSILFANLVLMLYVYILLYNVMILYNKIKI